MSYLDILHQFIDI